MSVFHLTYILYLLFCSRGVMILGPESIPETDFEHFSEFGDSESDSSKNIFLYCTGIDSKIRYLIMAMIPIPIPEKNGIITPLFCSTRIWIQSWVFVSSPSHLKGGSRFLMVLGSTNES